MLQINRLLATACFAAGVAYSQTQKSTVTGIVTDQTGAVLPGAEVALNPTGLHTQTNAQGIYVIQDVAPGDYHLQVHFIGLKPADKEVDVKAGAPNHLDVKLEVESGAQEITVKDARLFGEAASINEERSAENILQVLPSEVINSLPNANVADAIGRLPSVTLERDEGEGKYVQIRGTEPRYSNVTVDGIVLPSPEGVREIKLDVIPADLVNSVEINKTSLASQDAGGIGGSVNLTTRTASDLPTVSLYGMGGFTPILNTRGLDDFGGTVGKRFGRDQQLGLLVGGSYNWNGRGINDVEPTPTTVPGADGLPVGTFNTEDWRNYAYDRTRWGFDGTFDYRFVNGSSVYLRALYAHFDNFGDRIVYTPNINNFVTPFLGDDSGNMQLNAEIRRPVQSVGSIETGGRHDWGANSLTWQAAASRASTNNDGYSNANFDGIGPLNSVVFAVDRQDVNRPKLVSQNVSDLVNPASYQLTGSNAIDINRTNEPQVNLAAGADYSRGYSLQGHIGTFAMGGKFRNAHKFQESNDVYYNFLGGGDAALFSNFASSLTDPGYYDKSYRVGPFADYNKILSYFHSSPDLFSVNVNNTHRRNDPNNWDLIERVSAGYLMNTIEFGKWRLYAGLRFEDTHESVLGYKVLFQNRQYVSTNADRSAHDYLSPLPSAELRYTFDKSSDLRFAYGRNIARPNYSDLVPYVNIDDANFRGSVGNTNLKPTKADSFDVLYERYLNPIGLIQAGAFYKNITDPIYYITTNQVGVFANNNTPYQINTPQNGTHAWLAGFEIAYQQHWTFLPGLASGLGISANYSYTASRAAGLATLLGRSDNPALQRQAPHTWNVSPTYDKGRVSLRVGLSYNAANIWSYQYSDGVDLGKTGPFGDTYLATHFQVDAQASFRITHGISAIVSGLNLNNEVFGFYNGSPQWPIQREYYQPSYSMGFRWEPFTEKF